MRNLLSVVEFKYEQNRKLKLFYPFIQSFLAADVAF